MRRCWTSCRSRRGHSQLHLGLQLVSETQLTDDHPAAPGRRATTASTATARCATSRTATGTVTDTYDYDAFGNLINPTGTTPNNYLFAGEQFDPDLGLYYNRARYLMSVRAGSGVWMRWSARKRKIHQACTNLPTPSSESAQPDPPKGTAHRQRSALPSTRRPSPNITIVFNMAARVATTVSTRGLKFITAEEGLKTHLYPDSANNCTIGVGHLVHLGPCNGTDPSEKPFLHGMPRLGPSYVDGTLPDGGYDLAAKHDSSIETARI